MAEIVNLKQARKNKTRADKQVRAAGNRAKFGRDKATKAREKLEADQARKHLDGHRFDGETK